MKIRLLVGMLVGLSLSCCGMTDQQVQAWIKDRTAQLKAVIDHEVKAMLLSEKFLIEAQHMRLSREQYLNAACALARVFAQEDAGEYDEIIDDTGSSDDEMSILIYTTAGLSTSPIVRQEDDVMVDRALPLPTKDDVMGDRALPLPTASERAQKTRSSNVGEQESFCMTIFNHMQNQ